VTVTVRSARRLPDGRVLIAFSDKHVMEWDSVEAMRADLEPTADDRAFARRLLLMLAARRANGNLTTFRNLLESKSLSFDLSANPPITYG
jgi:hypothetical protein